ncbi:MAG: hypothetical protein U0R24_04390 [Solirubrobacterales bacterium]
MLFDLQGKRKRAVQVIYLGLAVLMGVGLIGLGIGGSANGGIFDALGIGGDGGSSDPQYDDQIDKANETLQSNPKDEKALITLTRYEFLSARDADEVDASTGQRTPTAESIDHYENSVDAWERYLATDPKNPDDDVASLAIQAYLVTIDPTSTLGDRDLRKLVDAAQIVADARPSFGTYSDLANYAYIAGEDDIGAEAAANAKKQAADSSQRKQVDQLVKQAKAARKQILAQRKQREQAEGGGELGGDDTGGSSLGGSSLLPQSPGVQTAP